MSQELKILKERFLEWEAANPEISKDDAARQGAFEQIKQDYLTEIQPEVTPAPAPTESVEAPAMEAPQAMPTPMPAPVASELPEPVDTTEPTSIGTMVAEKAPAIASGALRGLTMRASDLAQAAGIAALSPSQEKEAKQLEQIEKKAQAAEKARLKKLEDFMQSDAAKAMSPDAQQKLIEMHKELKAKSERGFEEVSEDGKTKPVEIPKSILDQYYEARKVVKEGEEAKAAKAPYSAFAAELAGGMAGFGKLAQAAKGLKAAGSPALRAAGKLLPTADVGTVRTAALEGAKAGALAGLVGGESETLKGDVLGTVGETVAGGAVGGAFGGGLSLAGKGLAALGREVGDTPIGRAFVQAYKKGKKGQTLESDSDIQEGTQQLYDIMADMQKKFSLEDEQISNIIERADVNVKAGQLFEDALTEAADSTIGLASNPKRAKMWQDLMATYAGKRPQPNLERAIAKVKKFNYERQAEGSAQRASIEVDKAGKPFIKYADSSDPSAGFKVEKIADEIPLTKIKRDISQDPDNFKLSELIKIKEEVDNFNPVFAKDSALSNDPTVQKQAKGLSTKLSDLINDKAEDALISARKLDEVAEELTQGNIPKSRAEVKKQLSELLSAKAKLNVDQLPKKLRSTDTKTQESFDRIFRKIANYSKNLKDQQEVDRAIDHLMKADPKALSTTYKQQLEDLSKNYNAIKSLESQSGFSLTMLARLGAKITNLTTRAAAAGAKEVKSIPGRIMTATKLSDMLKKASDSERTEFIRRAANKLPHLGDELRKISGLSEGKDLQKIMMTLYQRPEFRKFASEFLPEEENTEE